MDEEFRLLRKYFAPLSRYPGAQNLSNDAALLKFENKNSVISSDMMIEGIHFTTKHNPKFLAQKLLRVNLSDLAAMGAVPYVYLLNIAIPSAKTLNWLKDFSEGLHIDQKKFNIKLVGGDFSRSSKVFISISILGKLKKRFHSNSSAKAGSSIYVSNFIGDSAIGFKLNRSKTFSNLSELSKKYFIKKFLLPVPRIELGQKLLDYAEVCTDISDGLVRDLNKLCYHSRLGANIFCSRIPLSLHAKKLMAKHKNRQNFWETILLGGEDYELLFSVNKDKEQNFLKFFKTQVFKVGNFLEGSSVSVFDDKGKLIKLKNKGFSHF